MKRRIHVRRWLAVTALATIAVIVCVGVAEFITRPAPGSAEAILRQADKMAWVNNWIGAEPLFEKAERMFQAKGDSAHALYARVSEMPAHMESRPASRADCRGEQLSGAAGGKERRSAAADSHN